MLTINRLKIQDLNNVGGKKNGEQRVTVNICEKLIEN